MSQTERFTWFLFLLAILFMWIAAGAPGCGCFFFHLDDDRSGD